MALFCESPWVILGALVVILRAWGIISIVLGFFGTRQRTPAPVFPDVDQFTGTSVAGIAEMSDFWPNMSPQQSILEGVLEPSSIEDIIRKNILKSMHKIS